MFLIKKILLPVFLIVLIGCGSARRSEPVKGQLENVNERILAGEKVFNKHCHSCHPRGETGVGPAINNKPLPGFMIKFQVRNGIGKMPSFGDDKISKEELDNLIKYISALKNNK